MAKNYVNVNFNVSSDFDLLEKSGRNYVYMCDIDVKPGDFVVCETSGGFGVAVVIGGEFSSERTKLATAWIIQKIDIGEHNRKVAKEREKEEIKAKMILLKKQLEEEAIFAALAENNPEMAALLSKYLSL